MCHKIKKLSSCPRHTTGTSKLHMNFPHVISELESGPSHKIRLSVTPFANKIRLFYSLMRGKSMPA